MGSCIQHNFCTREKEGHAACLDDHTLAAFLEGALDSWRVREVDAHVTECETCFEVLLAATLLQSSRTVFPNESIPAERRPNLLPEVSERIAADVVKPSSRRVSTSTLVSVGAERFEQRSLIRRTNRSTVHRAYDTHTGRLVAIKQICCESTDCRRDELADEAAWLRKLDHPNIVKFVALVPKPDGQELVTEYVSGGSLRDMLRRTGPFPRATALKLLLEVCDGLAHAHHRGLVHGDIKPDNILLEESGRPRIVDFGLASSLRPRESAPEEMRGTPAYMSPEAILGSPLDERTDIWALGIILFELLSGKRPFEGTNPRATMRAVVKAPLPQVQQRLPEATPSLVALLERLLAKDPALRIRSARQLGAEIEAVLQAARDFESPTDSIPDLSKHSAHFAQGLLI